MKKSVLLKKLKSYSAVAASLTGMVSLGHAQIQYTDINPDTTIENNGDIYLLDLNNDTISDFRFQAYKRTSNWTNGGNNYYSNSEWIYLDPLISNAVNTYSTVINTFYGIWTMSAPAANNQNVNIGPSNKWMSTDYATMAWHFDRQKNSAPSSEFTVGPWVAKQDSFLSLKIIVSGKTYYGWARLDADSTGHNITIKDYAFNTKPDEPILAGDKGIVDAPEVTATNNNLTIYSFQNKIFIQTAGEGINTGQVSVFDISGKRVHLSTLNENKKQISLGDLPTGHYVVRIQTSEGVLNKKVFIQSNSN